MNLGVALTSEGKVVVAARNRSLLCENDVQTPPFTLPPATSEFYHRLGRSPGINGARS